MTRDPAPFGFPRQPPRVPPAAALDAVVREGRRRLRRQALWSAGAAAGAAAVFVGSSLLGPAGRDADLLIPASPGPGRSAAPDPTGGPQASSAPAGLEPTGDPDPAPRPSAQAAPLGGSGSAGEPAPAAVAADAQQQRPDDPATGLGPSRRTPYRENPQRTPGGMACQVDNAITGSPAGSHLCVTGRASGTVRRGETATVQLSVCNSIYSDRPATLSFASGREHDLRVRRVTEADPLWTWSRHHTFPQGPHSRQVAPGDCLVWQTAWNTRDDDGRLVEPGQYRLLSSADVNGRTTTVSFPVEIQKA